MAKKLWGSRFPKKISAQAQKFTSSISFDRRLAKYDILGSIAHVKMLGKQKIIPAKDALLIEKGLNSILQEVGSGKFRFDSQAEDIHSNIQEALIKRIGQAANKLHAARSRNDQVVLDVKMYLKDEAEGLANLITQLQKSILKFAQANSGVIIPGYTHLQRAQCVLFAHHLLAYVEGLQRDKERIRDAKKRIDSMPLGSGALSGTGLPIDREYVKSQLGFKELTANSIDSVSDRDFVIEVLGGLSILSVHLSRMAEDLILWSTKEFNFIEIDFSFCTGSSIMPHKKNPDILELIRGAAGKVIGALSSVLILLKGLPSSYNRDLQLDKPALFEALDAATETLVIFEEVFKNIKVNKEAIALSLADESLFSVDIMEYLIKKGLSYREAHDIVGRMVRDCLDKGKKISELTNQQLKGYSDKLSGDVKDILNASASVNLKASYGSTNPKLVAKQLKRWLGIVIVLFSIFSLSSSAFSEETLTITTYYPSPYGSYNELRTYSNTYLATNSGNVGIGTTTPKAKLDVEGTIYGWVIPSDVKVTAREHSGNFGGYNEMHNWIQSNGCAGYHVCDATELTRYYQAHSAGAFKGWYNRGALEYFQSDCEGWTFASGTFVYSGPVWEKSIPSAYNCISSLPVMCCK